MNNRQVRYLRGQKFNKLNVIKFSHKIGAKVYWRCRCDCGTESVVSGSALISGATKSCGCGRVKVINEVHHFDGGVTAIGIFSPKYGEQFTLIDTKDYPKIEGERVIITRNGRLTKRLYAVIGEVQLHFILYGNEVPKNKIIDHKDNTDTLDNRRQNIRFGTRQQNTFNRGKPNNVTASSKYKGVYFSKERNKYRARLTYNYKSIHLGQYKTQEEAAIAYNNGAIKYFGEFALLNKLST